MPGELKDEEQVALVREFAQREFVSQGMVADINIHRDNRENPHAHVLLTMRAVSEKGFGLKERRWNDRAQLKRWRASWAEVANERLARAQLGMRIDHRSYADQGIELTPGRKIGVSVARQRDGQLPPHLATRVAQQKAIARENGEKILKNPHVALDAMSRQQESFTHRDVAKFLHTHTQGAEQFRAAFVKVTASQELVAVAGQERGEMRFAWRKGLEQAQAMEPKAHQPVAQQSDVPQPIRGWSLEDRMKRRAEYSREEAYLQWERVRSRKYDLVREHSKQAGLEKGRERDYGLE